MKQVKYTIEKVGHHGFWVWKMKTQRGKLLAQSVNYATRKSVISTFTNLFGEDTLSITGIDKGE